MTRKFILLLAFLALSASAAYALGLGEGNRFGRLGSIKMKGAAAPPATCSGTGLIFNVACNSQYIPML